MKIEKLRISDVRYNPERAAFEAKVTLHDGGRTYGYPCHVTAPIHADFDLIASGLTDKAIARHQSANHGMRSHLRWIVPKRSSHLPLAA